MKLLKIIILLLTITLNFAACESEKKLEKDNGPIKLIKNTKTIKNLLQTLNQGIKAGDRKFILSLYSEKSQKTISYNNKLGIGTAGTIDEKILFELENRKKYKSKLILIKKNGNYLTIKWPSGDVYKIYVVYQKSEYRIDVIKSPGGDILLIKE